MSQAHARLGASSAHRWMKCPASVRAEAAYGDQSSQAAREGTDAHELAKVCLLNGEVDATSYIGLPVSDVFGHPGESGHATVQAEWVDSVNVYLEHVWSLSKPDLERYVEERVSLEVLRPDMYGTADCLLVDPAGKTLTVVDFKHGVGSVVEVEDNPQLLYYALAALMRCHNYQIETVTVTIVQPRAAHPDGRIRSKMFAATALVDFMCELSTTAEATDDPNAPFVPGEHCKFCKHKANCEALRAEAVSEFSSIEAPAVPGLDDAELARRYLALATVEAYAKAIKAEAMARASAKALKGETMPGTKWVRGRGSREWVGDGLKVAADLEAALGVDITERVLPSPAQVEKAVGKKTYTAFVKPHVNTKPGKPKLVSIDAAGEPITPTADDWKTSEFAPIEAE